ncbi:MAG: carboxypeptidase-like regulatory domain-containing protein [Acidobacteriota bacterium]|nr:carboxypeptidase-like regulatory domain-containing protein [Acidobacteriota bacterium]MDH3784167.1 carboxypeptidase-like regulatory domain-containing protein [Acidobacteriota bacterium]
MYATAKRITSFTLMIALSLFVLPVSAAPSAPTGAIEGLVIGVDGTPATGFSVHLIDPSGTAVSESAVDEQGRYSFSAVAEGEYALGIESDAGTFAPVVAPPVKLGSRELARRDLKLMNGTTHDRNEALTADYSLGSWWAGLAPAAKVWSVVAVVAASALTLAAFDSDESVASELLP